LSCAQDVNRNRQREINIEAVNLTMLFTVYNRSDKLNSRVKITEEEIKMFKTLKIILAVSCFSAMSCSLALDDLLCNGKPTHPYGKGTPWQAANGWRITQDAPASDLIEIPGDTPVQRTFQAGWINHKIICLYSLSNGFQLETEQGLQGNHYIPSPSCKTTANTPEQCLIKHVPGPIISYLDIS
jgi:hypothetical protein